MIDIPFDVAVLSACCLALATGVGMSLLKLNASAMWLRKWRVALAIGLAVSLVGVSLGIIRMTAPWHPYSGTLCAALMAGGTLVAMIAGLVCLGVFGPSGGSKTCR
ncbi:hypothetical protein BLA13014_07590 [Burkholderia aenigmatica]|uniref:Uncharacterized protein n=1 Tax=Burkholderia aenigmatica TaxID=2015348 RepID=A0A6P2SHK8_9BURK|nr:hypothetical protein [Burkholderia aenigmatica]VWC49401.1 hypothetical protein BLA13014_07590 [Burkholderia aenigmatica]